MQRSFGIEENSYKYSDDSNGVHFQDGLELTPEESKYLLPHFLMLLVGKPGSGKTTIMKQLLTNKKMYKGKFDFVFVISPSFAKMGIKLPADHMVSTFSLTWIFDKIAHVNKKQSMKVQKGTTREILLTAKDSVEGMQKINRLSQNKLLTQDVLTSLVLHRPGMVATPKDVINQKKRQQKGAAKSMIATEQDMLQVQMMKEFQKLTDEQRRQFHVNVLFVLDDVVGDIKNAETDPLLAQLVMNRRHLIMNGTISLMVVTQKYTLIPARFRSNASWLILFRLNPLDFENVYKDAITKSSREWHDLLQFVYDGTSNAVEENKEEEDKKKKKNETFAQTLKDKKYDNLGIWVEFNMFFKNFKRILL